MRDATISNIATMADDRLAVEPDASSTQNKSGPEAEPEPESADAIAPELIVPDIADGPAQSETAETPPSLPKQAAAQQGDGTEPLLRASLSPGIRSLISRLPFPNPYPS